MSMFRKIVWRNVSPELIIGAILIFAFGAVVGNIDASMAQTAPKASPTPISVQCEKFYNYSMNYLKKAETGIGSFEVVNGFYTKSSAYGVAYQSCVARSK